MHHPCHPEDLEIEHCRLMDELRSCEDSDRRDDLAGQLLQTEALIALERDLDSTPEQPCTI